MTVGTVMAQSRLVRWALMHMVVVGGRVTVAISVTAVVHWRARTRWIGTVRHRVPTKQAHVTQGAKHGAAAGSPVRVSLRGERGGTRAGSRKTGLEVIVQGRVLRFGSVIVPVQMVIGREAGRVLDAARYARGGRSPTTSAVVRTMLVVAVEAGRRVAAIVGRRRRT